MIKVAISDAHAVTREGVRNALESAGGFEVVGEAVDGESTLALVGSTKAGVLTLGLAMPGIHGIQLIELIRKSDPSLRILILTMRSEAAQATQAFKAGASGFVSKDSPTADVISAVRKVASGGVYVSLAMADQFAQSFFKSANALPHQRLSDRELDIFLRIASGERVAAIGRTLCMSAKTVSSHRTHILEKTGLQNDAGLVRYAFRHELLEGDGIGESLPAG
ncbi:response regulator [Paraburkholderia sp. RL17-381-BIF-C]|uniref:response regulator n=1 Tax=Paraburkholderia sp. RL17-381-BIF-C TaxID=3031635 RepID=UPI0038BC3CA0